MARAWWTRGLVAVALAALAACGDGEAPADDEPLVCEQRSQTVVPPVDRMDLLVVIDRTPSMARNAALSAELAALIDEFDWADLHVAVVTSEQAAAVTGCDPQRTGLVVPDPARCGIDGPYLQHGASRNYTGSLAEAVGCLLDAPLSTCPVSQPLAATAAALDTAAAQLGDFRRPDRAFLAVAILTDSDDCSLVDPAALGLAPGASEAAVDFACFARGTTCDQADPAAPGAHTGCRHRPGAGFVDPVATRALLASFGGAVPTRIVVRGGRPEVTVEDGQLVPSCAGEELTAGPAPRLGSIGAIPAEFSLASCQSFEGNVLFGAFQVPIPATCLDPSVDRQAEVPGIQSECNVVTFDADGAEVEVLAACNAPTRDASRPCWAFDPVFGPRVCDEGGLLLTVYPGSQVVAERWASVRCATDCGP